MIHTNTRMIHTNTYTYIHIHTHTYTLYNYMLSKLVMLRAQAAVSSTCGGILGHWSPNIAPAQTMLQVHCTEF